jgi:hypothetical protein
MGWQLRSNEVVPQHLFIAAIKLHTTGVYVAPLRTLLQLARL